MGDRWAASRPLGGPPEKGKCEHGNLVMHCWCGPNGKAAKEARASVTAPTPAETAKVGTISGPGRVTPTILAATLSPAPVRGLDRFLNFEEMWQKAHGLLADGTPDPDSVTPGRFDRQYLRELIEVELQARIAEATEGVRKEYAPLVVAVREWQEARREYEEDEERWDAPKADRGSEAYIKHIAAITRLDNAESALAALGGGNG